MKINTEDKDKIIASLIEEREQLFIEKESLITTLRSVEILIKKYEEQLNDQNFFNSISDLRKLISFLFLKGEGIEIGALHNPLPVSENLRIKYVDRFDEDNLRKQYPELNNCNLVKVDIVDDGEKLTKIKDESLNFIIANHFIEHCRNPIGSIENFITKVKNKGLIYLAVPDKRYTKENEREKTDFEHLTNDYNGNINEDFNHFIDWAIHWNKITDEKKIQERAKYLYDMNYSIHYHCWDSISYLEFLQKTNKFLNYPFEIKCLIQNGEEIISILEKLSE